MQRYMAPFEQDFLLVDESNVKGRQGSRYGQAGTAIPSPPNEEIWGDGAPDSISEQIADKSFDEQCATVWESTLERL